MCVPDLTPLELYWEVSRRQEVGGRGEGGQSEGIVSSGIPWTNGWHPRHYNLNDLALGFRELEINETG